jgi:hypothetical protein
MSQKKKQQNRRRSQRKPTLPPQQIDEFMAQRLMLDYMHKGLTEEQVADETAAWSLPAITLLTPDDLTRLLRKLFLDQQRLPVNQWNEHVSFIYTLTDILLMNTNPDI